MGNTDMGSKYRTMNYIRFDFSVLQFTAPRSDTVISFDLTNEQIDIMYLDYLWFLALFFLLFMWGFVCLFFSLHNLELCFVFTQLIWIKYLLVLTEKNNFEMIVWILDSALFPTVKIHEVMSTSSSTEKEWMTLVFLPFA